MGAPRVANYPLGGLGNMILNRIENEDGTIEFRSGRWWLDNLHPETVDCYKHGCVAHSPTPTDPANIGEWPYNWREDTGVMERLCPHGISHPDFDAANYATRHGNGWLNVHGCDGCCQ